jgi:hypothetical protein
MRTDKKDCACRNARHRHGTWHAYATDNCGCPPCREAWRRYCAQLRKRRYLCGGSMLTDPCGVSRRLQALAVNGWGSVDVARELGCTKFVVEQWRAGATPRVTHRTHARIAALYDRLWDQPSPSRYARKVRNIATRAGWAGPFDWDDGAIDDPDAKPYTPKPQARISSDVDDIAVERRIAGDFIHLTYHETRAAVLLLHERGWNVTTIATRLRISGFSVNQHLERKDTAA